MQPDRSAVAGAWLAASSRDLRAAQRLRDDEPALACFHAQQSAEKALKAAAVVAIGDVERSHSLVRILRDLSTANIAAPDEIVRACQILERYYATTRYPDAIGGIDPGEIYSAEDSIETLALANDVVAFARTIVTTS